MAKCASAGLRIIALSGLALASSWACAQDGSGNAASAGYPTTTAEPVRQPAPDHNAMMSARAARSARLMDEFRTILDASVAKRLAEANQGAVATTADVSSPASASASTSLGPDSQVQASRDVAPAAPRTGENRYLPIPGVKDPALDYSGLACEFFTRPRNSDGTSNVHADGAWVAYGKNMYQCVNRRWSRQGSEENYVGAADRQAGILER